MSLLGLLFVLIIIGVVLWAVTAYIPMPPAIRNLIVIVGVVVAVMYVLSAFGIFGQLEGVKVPSISK